MLGGTHECVGYECLFLEGLGYLSIDKSQCQYIGTRGFNDKQMNIDGCDEN